MLMSGFYGNKEGLVSFVSDQLSHLEPDYALTMTIRQDKFGGYSVSTVIDISLDGMLKNTPSGMPEQLSMFDKGQGFSYLQDRDPGDEHAEEKLVDEC